MDFTIETYVKLLKALHQQGFVFQTFSDFIRIPASKAIVLRHDVDLLPQNALNFAIILYEFGIRGSYYFRAVPESWDKKIVLQIAGMGHEIGYHYETMDSTNAKCKMQNAKSKMKSEELIDEAYKEFCVNLEMFRKIVPVTTICMHGSPRSKYDNKMVWEKYDYKKLGILGEPYFDIDFNKVAYLTDTGRRWNGDKVSLRDKVVSPFNFNFRSTYDIIGNISLLPDKTMFTFHPQRWHDNFIHWCKELILQNVKNQIKRFLVK